VGSVLVGSADFIARAYRWRKVLGGGMRQSGFLAAACLYAFDHQYQRLAQDHLNAERLAKGLGGIKEIAVAGQATNMVFARFPREHCQPLQAHLAGRGILAQITAETRFVTHLDVAEADIDAVVEAARQYFR
jgi:threonine aldolase